MSGPIVGVTPSGLIKPVLVSETGSLLVTDAGAAVIDRELVVTTYFVKTAFTGASVGDTVTATQVLDVSGTPVTISTVWRNQSTALDISAPAAANLTLVGSNAVTDAQMAARGYALEGGNLLAINNKVPALGQALAAASTPVVLTAAQVAALTPLTVVQTTSLDLVTSGTITTTDVVVAAPAGTGAFVSGASTSGSLVAIATGNGATSWDVSVLNMTSGSLWFEGSLDSSNGTDGNWINLNTKQSGLTNASIVTVANSNGLYRGNLSSLKYFRVRSAGALTGSPTIIIRLGVGIDALFLSAPLPAGVSPIGRIGALCSNSSFVPTVTASSAYATGNAVGGLITITNAVRSTTLSALLQWVKVTSASAQASSSFDVFLFNASPTAPTDKTAYSVAAADLTKLIYVAHCTDLTTAGATIHQADNSAKPFSVASGTSIYAVIVVRGTPTFTATTDVTLSVGIIQD